MGRFDGRVAIVTGGSRGIGKGIATKLAEEGAKIAIFDVNEQTMEETAQEFRNHEYELTVSFTDVANSEQVNQSVTSVVEKFGKVDILVNNAGITRDNLLHKMTDDDWQTVMDVHLKGSFNCARAVQKYMVEKKYGRIVNISSGSAFGRRGQANYATAKAGLLGFTRTLAMELGKFGITTNVVAPGYTVTEMTIAAAERMGITIEDLNKQIVPDIPVGRPGRPQDIANAVAFFCDEASSFVNGQFIYIGGGPKGEQVRR